MVLVGIQVRKELLDSQDNRDLLDKEDRRVSTMIVPVVGII